MMQLNELFHLPVQPLKGMVPQAILASRHNIKHELLVVVSDPRKSFWADYDEVQTITPDLLELYETQVFFPGDDFFYPCSVQLYNNVYYEQYRTPQTDFYVETPTSAQVEKQLKIQAFSFNLPSSLEELAARAIFAPPPLYQHADFYLPVQRQFFYLYAPHLLRNSSAWALCLNPVELMKEFYKMHLTPLAVYGADYFTTARELQKFGIVSTRRLVDFADCYFLNAAEEHPRQCKSIISFGITNIKGYCRRRLLVLQDAKYTKGYADFLGVQTVKDFAFLELANLEQVLTIKPRMTPVFGSVENEKTTPQSGSQAYICKYNITFGEAVRVKYFLENDACVAKVIGEHYTGKKDRVAFKSAAGWMEMTVWIIGNLLQRLWCKNDGLELGERKVLISSFIRGFMSCNINLLTVVVPDVMINACMAYFSARSDIQLLTTLHNDVYLYFDDRRFKIILLSESQICAYFITCRKFRKFVNAESLSYYILFPFTSTRNIEFYTYEVFFYSGFKTPVCYTILCNNSIEEQIMVFRYQMCHISQLELENLSVGVQNYYGYYHETFEYVLGCIRYSGFDGNWTDGRYNWKNYGLPSYNDDAFDYMYYFSHVNRCNFNHHILYAALLDLFNINPSYNIFLFSSYLYNARNCEAMDYQGLCKIDLAEHASEQYQLFYYQYSKAHDYQFYSAFYFPNLQQSQTQICDTIDKQLVLNQQSGESPGKKLFEYVENGYQFGMADVLYLKVSGYVEPYIYLPIYKFPAATTFYGVRYIDFQLCDDNISKENDTILSVGNVVQSDVETVKFVYNQQLSFISYAGGSRFDQLIIKRATEYFKYKELLLESLQSDAYNYQAKLEHFIAALGLIDYQRCYSINGVYKGFDFEKPSFPPYYIVNYVIYSTAKFTTRNDLFDLINYNYILLHVTPFELFIPMQVLIRQQTSVDYQLLFKDSIYNFTEQFIKNNFSNLGSMQEYIYFFLDQLASMKISSLAQVYGEYQHFSLINNLIKAYKGEKSGSVKFTNQLLSAPVFYTKCIAGDSLILQTYFSLPSSYQQSELAKAKLNQICLYQGDSPLFILHKCFSQTIKNISCTSVYYFMPQADLLITLDQLYKQSPWGLYKLLNIGYDMPHFFSGTYFPLANRKIFTSSIVYNLNDIKTKMLALAKETRPNPFKKEEPESSEIKIDNIKIPTIIPVKIGNETSNFTAESNLEEGRRFSYSNQLADHSSGALKGKLDMEVYLQGYFDSDMQPVSANISFYSAYVDQVIYYISKELFYMTMKRIMNHYSCRSYYFHKNLLYVPEVCIIYAADAVKHQFGYPVKYLEAFETDENFNTLLYILTNEFYKYNLNKSPNIHKFCTVFNENIKKKLEIVSKLPQLKMEFYTSILVFYQWIVKRTIYAECDLNKGSLIVFKQDPVLGIDLDKCSYEIPKLKDKLRFAKYTDRVFENQSDKQIYQYYDYYTAYLNYIPQEYRNKQLLMLVKIGIGTGSTPLETFYRFIYKDDPFKVSKTLAYLTNLLVLCQYKNLEFPYKVPNITTSAEEVNSSIYRLEHMRFLHIKLYQFDFLQWLQRLQDFRNADMTDGEIEMIFSVMQRQMICNTTTLYDHDSGLTESEKSLVKYIGVVAADIDTFNSIIWYIDIIFNEFIPDTDSSYNMLKAFRLERFAINDFDYSGIKVAWEISAYFKLLFLALFGNSKSKVIEALKNQGNDNYELDIKMVHYIYEYIYQIWSRLHDFILCHIITDMGYTEAMMQSVVGKDSRQKSKHVEFLRQGRFYTDEQLILSTNSLYDIYEKIRTMYPDEPTQGEIVPKAVNVPCILQLKKPNIYLPTPTQIVYAISMLRPIPPEEIFDTYPVAKELLTHRVEKIALALRCERVLVCDPLQKYIIDRSVSLLPPNARPVRVMTCPYLSDNELGGFIAQPYEIPRSVERKIDYKQAHAALTQRQSAYYSFSQAVPALLNSLAQPRLLIPNVYAVTAQSAQSSLNSTPNAGSGTLAGLNVTIPVVQPLVYGSLVETAPGSNVQQYTSQRSLQRAPLISESLPASYHGITSVKHYDMRLYLPRITERIILNTKLEFCRDDEKEVTEQILEFLSKAPAGDFYIIKQELDDFLFYMSTCYLNKKEVWGRMYSWLSNFKISDHDTLITEQRKYFGYIYDHMYQCQPITSATQLLQTFYQIYVVYKKEPGKIDVMVYNFLEATLNLAYYHADNMRSYIIKNPTCDMSERQRKIVVYMHVLTFFGDEYLRVLLEQKHNKRKFALCSFLYSCERVE